MAREKKFSLIVLDLGSLISEEVLNENYREINSIKLNDIAWGSCTAKIYVPRQ